MGAPQLRPRLLNCGHVLIFALPIVMFPVGGASQESAPPKIDKNGYNLFNPTPRTALREMEALYRNPYTVDAGHAQIETYVVGYAYERQTATGADGRTETWRVAPTTLKLGLLNSVDIELETSPYTRVRTVDRLTGTTSTRSGFGDLIPRAKFNLWGNDGGPSAAALLPFIKIPTSQDGLGNNSVEAGLGLPIGLQLPFQWWLQLSPELSLLRNVDDGGYSPGFSNTIYLWHAIAGKLSGYIEFSSWVSFERTSGWIGTIDFGMTYMIGRDIQLDAGVLIGVTRAAPVANPFLGVSARF